MQIENRASDRTSSTARSAKQGIHKNHPIINSVQKKKTIKIPVSVSTDLRLGDKREVESFRKDMFHTTPLSRRHSQVGRSLAAEWNQVVVLAQPEISGNRPKKLFFFLRGKFWYNRVVTRKKYILNSKITF